MIELPRLRRFILRGMGDIFEMAKVDRLEAVVDNRKYLKIAAKGNEAISDRDLFQKIINKLFKQREIRFNKQQIKSFISPCVYVFLRGNDALYVGMSRIGIQRTFTKKYGNAISEDLFKDSDELIMISFDTEGEAREAEKYLIKKLLPLYNRI